MSWQESVKSYLDLNAQFPEERIPAAEFESEYLISFKAEGSDLPSEVYEIRNERFFHVGKFIANNDERRAGLPGSNELFASAKAGRRELEPGSSTFCIVSFNGVSSTAYQGI